MVELARGPDNRFGFALGGDSFNTAVYLARAGVTVAYMTALGDDAYSRAILDLAERERVDVSAVPISPGRLPGIYLIETDAQGERSFYYWRETSPARDLFTGEAPVAVAEQLLGAELIYFTGVTLWLYRDQALDNFFRLLSAAKARGAKIAFDSNYRQRLWGPDLPPARTIFARAIALADMVLPSLDDDRLLWGDADAQAALRRYRTGGVVEIAVKDGAGGVFIWEGDDLRHLPPPRNVAPLDTTAAGDSFNAAYLAARLAGRSPGEAVMAGHRLAAIVISERGAIVPEAATREALADLRNAFQR
jgi:2-dehydro-3-deoxygluconokinase